MVKVVQSPLQIRLTEPVIYLRGPSTGADFRGRPLHARDGQQAMVRGLLTLRLTKATRIRSIMITLEGKCRTEWPEGVGPRRTDTFEESECMNEKITFFSAQEAIKDRAARRSLSVDAGGWAQYDVDSDDDSSGDEGDLAVRGRTLPSSLLPRHSGDWSSWQQGSGRRTDSVGGSNAPSRQVSTADLSMLRESSLGLDGLRLDGRAPSQAHIPSLSSNQSPSISSHPSSILLHGGQNSRGRSPMTAAPVDMPRRASDRADEWQPTTPTGEPESLINFPSGQDVAGAPSGGVRFQSPEELEAQHEAAMQGASEAEANPNGAASLHSVNSSGTGESADAAPQRPTEYHPVDQATLACPTNAVTTPTNETPPPGSPLLRARHDSSTSAIPATANGSFANDNGRHPSARYTPSQTSSLRQSPHLGPSQPNVEMRYGKQSAHGPSSTITYHGDLNASPRASGSATPDERGRQKHHRFSLAAALRGLSQDVKERVTHSSSRPPSRPLSRAGSRTRGTETPRADGLASLNLSRQSSRAAPNRAAASDLFPHGGWPGRSSRASSPARDGRDESRGRTRSRARKAKEDQLDEVHNWKEFRKGVYNYPIAFQVPADAPPTIHAEFGKVTYRLKATVIRVGALTPNLIEEKEITMIAGPQEDDLEETENVIVERQWEDQMRYLIALSGKAFPIGGIIPISIRLMPLAKCKVYRITVSLEEKTDYFAVGKKVARHETPRRYILFAAKNNDKRDGPEPLLPILSDASNAAQDSPLAPLARLAAMNNPLEFSDFIDPVDNVYASLLDPIGPWHLEKELHVPDCTSRIKFTTKHETTNISVGHWLKVTIRVERGDDKAIDSKGRRKQFDIIIETPIKILDCRVNTAYNSLPSYDRLGSDQNPLHAGCSVHAKTGGAANHKQNSLIGGGGLSHSVLTTLAQTTHVVQRNEEQPHLPHGPGLKEHDDTLLERNIVYDRLISGQETETGEEPPTYKEAVAHAIRSASRAASRSHSRVASPGVSRANSRAPSRSQSRAPSRMPSPSRGPSRNTSVAQLFAQD